MNDEDLELVTAYVDGEATADERARVEADAELLAEVDVQRAARAQLHDVDPPSESSRESAIAAALAVFDNEVASTIRPSSPAAPDVTAPTNIVPFEQRRRMRWMQSIGAAAAVTAVVVAGAVIATRGGDDNGSTADQVRENPELSVAGVTLDQDAADQAPAAQVTTTQPGVLMATEPTEPLADAAGAAEAEGPDATSVNEYDDNAATGGAPGAVPTTIPGAPAAPAPATAAAAARVVIVITENDLRELADTLTAPPLDIDDAETECADGGLEAEATFEDEAGDQHSIVVVAVDDETLGALTLDDCDVVLEADLDPAP